MLQKIFLIAFLIVSFFQSSKAQKIYHKEYYANGTVKAEGWLLNDNKVDYWKLYHTNGIIAEKGHYKNNIRQNYWYFYSTNNKPKLEGHYEKGKMTNWWLYYDANGKVNHKCQLNMGVKNGYCLMYKNEKIASAAKFRNGKKIKEWFNLKNFKKENNLSDLR